MVKEEYSETETARAEALYKWIECDADSRKCLELARELDGARETLKGMASAMNMLAPSLCPKLKDIRAELWEMSKELERESSRRSWDWARYVKVIVADDPMKEEGEAACQAEH